MPGLEDSTTFNLTSVTCDRIFAEGRSGVRVRLSPAVESDGTPGVDYIDQPTFALLPGNVEDAIVEVDIFSRLRPHAPDYARGFAGIAFRVSDDEQHFEGVYLRPSNGLRTHVEEPRRSRGMQYFSYPEWPFDRLRAERPAETFEAPADIALEQWSALRLEFRGKRVTAQVNGGKVIVFADALTPPRPGRLGLWVDIGTDAIFSNLRIREQGEPPAGCPGG